MLVQNYLAHATVAPPPTSQHFFPLPAFFSCRDHPTLLFALEKHFLACVRYHQSPISGVAGVCLVFQQHFDLQHLCFTSQRGDLVSPSVFWLPHCCHSALLPSALHSLTLLDGYQVLWTSVSCQQLQLFIAKSQSPPLSLASHSAPLSATNRNQSPS